MWVLVLLAGFLISFYIMREWLAFSDKVEAIRVLLPEIIGHDWTDVGFIALCIRIRDQPHYVALDFCLWQMAITGKLEHDRKGKRYRFTGNL